MLHVYIDYPVPHMTIQGDSACPFIRPFARPRQRTSKITLETLSRELKRFADKEYKFASVAIMNDIWLEIDLDDTAFERAVAEYVSKPIARHKARVFQSALGLTQYDAEALRAALLQAASS